MDALDQNSRTPLQTLAIKGTHTCLAYHLKRSFLILYTTTAFKEITIPAVVSRELGVNFGSYLYQTALSDITFVLPERSFPAHKIILCAQSSPFQR